VLLASLVIGLIVGILQAMTQVQDQTVSFVPKLLCLLVVLGLCLPWLTDQMVDYTSETLSKPMTHFNATVPVSPASFVRTAENSSVPQDESYGPLFNLPRVDDPETELKSPFSLPHYRYSRLPKENIDG
jgi:flagellar biosynthesis protein FliQ